MSSKQFNRQNKRKQIHNPAKEASSNGDENQEVNQDAEESIDEVEKGLLISVNVLVHSLILKIKSLIVILPIK